CTKPGQIHGGLRIWNNSSINYLRRVKIKEGKPGILVSGPGAIGHTEFRDCLIQNNYDGIKWNGGFHVVRNSDFTGNTRHAIYGLNLNGSSTISKSNFGFSAITGISSTGSAIDLQGQEGSMLNLKNSSINGFSTGVHVNDIDLRGDCNTIENNSVGVKSENSIVYLNNDASNTFRWNESANIILSGSSNGGGIYLFEGFNQFDLPLNLTSSFRHIDGAWNCYMPYLDYSSNYQFANFNYNKFQVPVNASFTSISDYFELNVTSCTNPMNLMAGIAVDLSEDNYSGPNCNSGPAVNLHPSYATLGELQATSGKVSNGQVYIETPLYQALDQALGQLSFGEDLRNDKGALQSLIAILQGNISSLDSNSQAYLNLAYNAMHQALNQAYQQGQLQHNEGEAQAPVEELEDLISIVDDCLLTLNFTDSTDHAKIFQLNLDKVHALRVAGHYSESLSLLNNRTNWTFNYTQSQRAGYWNCVCEQEQSYFNDEIPAEEFSYKLDLCRLSFAGYTYKRNNFEQETSKDAISNIKAYPQPVEDVLTIELSGVRGDEVKLEVLSLGGKLIKSLVAKNSNNTYNLDMSDLLAGFYLVRVSGNDYSEVLKVLKR
ncbi:MAG: T9SS type A sorting domain-containing protein, partial [Croceimicrobium sp.]